MKETRKRMRNSGIEKEREKKRVEEKSRQGEGRSKKERDKGRERYFQIIVISFLCLCGVPVKSCISFGLLHFTKNFFLP